MFFFHKIVRMTDGSRSVFRVSFILAEAVSVVRFPKPLKKAHAFERARKQHTDVTYIQIENARAI